MSPCTAMLQLASMKSELMVCTGSSHACGHATWPSSAGTLCDSFPWLSRDNMLISSASYRSH